MKRRRAAMMHACALVHYSKHSLHVQWETPVLTDYLTSKFNQLGQNTTSVMSSAVPLVFIMPSGIATLKQRLKVLSVAESTPVT